MCSSQFSISKAAEYEFIHNEPHDDRGYFEFQIWLQVYWMGLNICFKFQDQNGTPYTTCFMQIANIQVPQLWDYRAEYEY